MNSRPRWLLAGRKPGVPRNYPTGAGAGEHPVAWSRSSSRISTRVLTAATLAPTFLINLAVILWLWWTDGGVTAIHTAGALTTSIGRVTGLLGAFLLLVQVVLIVRLPLLKRLVGFDRLTVWHRLNGKLCLYLILAHVVFITIGYALLDRISIPAEVSTLLTQYPGMIAATNGTVFIVLVAVTAIVIVKRRLRYESWYLVHLLAYAGIVLAWFHEIPTGNEFVVNRAAALYWTALYLATLALLVLFRVAVPAARSLWFRLRVAEVIVEGPNVVSLRITGHHLDRLHARAGQFFLWRFLSAGRFWELHPFSLSAVPDGKSLRITVKSAGDFTRRLGEIRPGTHVIVEGPFGVLTWAGRTRDRVVLIAGGIGITPIRAMLEEHGNHADGCRVALIYRVNSTDELIFRDELEAFARDRGIRLHFVVGDYRTPGCENSLSPEHLRQLAPDIGSSEIYLCGPPAMMSAVEENLRRLGIPRQCVHSEKFAL